MKLERRLIESEKASLEAGIAEREELDVYLSKARVEASRLKTQMQDAYKECHIAGYKRREYMKEIEEKQKRVLELDDTIDLYRSVSTAVMGI